MATFFVKTANVDASGVIWCWSILVLAFRISLQPYQCGTSWEQPRKVKINTWQKLLHRWVGSRSKVSFQKREVAILNQLISSMRCFEIENSLKQKASWRLTPVELGQRHALPGWHGQVGRILPSHYNSFGNFLKSLQFHGKNHQQKLRFSAKKNTSKTELSKSLQPRPWCFSNFRSQKSLSKPILKKDPTRFDSMRAFNRLMMQLASCLGHLKVLESELEPPMEFPYKIFRQTLGVRKWTKKKIGPEISSWSTQTKVAT